MSAERGTSRQAASELTAEDLLEVLKHSAEEVFVTMSGLVGVLVEQALSSDPAPMTEHVDQVEYEAVVSFSGDRSGAVILRAGSEGAHDIARGLLMMGEDEPIEVEEVMDALGECANMLTGSLKREALDTRGSFSLGTPSIGRRVELNYDNHLGGLVYRLARGCTAVEVWMDETPQAEVPQPEAR